MKTARAKTLRTPTRVSDLVPDANNRRKHNPRNIGMLVDALKRVGAARSIVLDEVNTVLAGNGVLQAAVEAGITKVQVVDVDGQTIVAVRRKGLSVDEKRELAIYDNRTAELAEWDTAQLLADAKDGLDLQPWFTPGEQAKLLGIMGAVSAGVQESVPEAYQVLVSCMDESTQARLLEKLTKEGHECRALMS